MHKKGGAREGSSVAKAHKLQCALQLLYCIFLSFLHFERMTTQNTSSYRDTTELIEL